MKKIIKIKIVLESLVILAYICGVVMASYSLAQYGRWHSLYWVFSRMDKVQDSLELYYNKNKNYPKDLITLEKEGYLNEHASWDGPNNCDYYYFSQNAHSYILASKGNDRIFGTKDDIPPSKDTIKHIPENFQGERVFEWKVPPRDSIEFAFRAFSYFIIPIFLIWELIFIKINYRKNKDNTDFKNINRMSIGFTVILIVVILAALKWMLDIRSIWY